VFANLRCYPGRSGGHSQLELECDKMEFYAAGIAANDVMYRPAFCFITYLVPCVVYGVADENT
jgi:hypothetical protein